MRYISGIPVPSWEVKDTRFFPLEKAQKLLRYKGDKRIFLRALNKLHLL